MKNISKVIVCTIFLISILSVFSCKKKNDDSLEALMREARRREYNAIQVELENEIQENNQETVSSNENDFEIIQKDGGITITGYIGGQTEVIIPSRISGIAVYSIGINAFSNKGITKVSFTEGLRTIGESAFSYNNLTTIIIPNSVTVIGTDAFSDNQISILTLSNRINMLQGGAFARNKIENLVIPTSLDWIYGSTFIGNPIKTLNLGGALTVIDRAFEGSEVESITLLANVNFNPLTGLELSFINYYNDNGKMAGTYIKNGRIWSRQ